jgi:hypothetical protein
MNDGSVYKMVTDGKSYFLEHHNVNGAMEVVAKGDRDLVEEAFAQKTAGTSIAAPIAATLIVEPEVSTAVDPLNFDCSNDPCDFPDCECEPVAAPVDPRPFGE